MQLLSFSVFICTFEQIVESPNFIVRIQVETSASLEILNLEEILPASSFIATYHHFLAVLLCCFLTNMDP